MSVLEEGKEEKEEGKKVNPQDSKPEIGSFAAAAPVSAHIF